jgi:pSer/pThr/pTyr-binding forkhead associated (FHA) protein
MEAKFCPFCQRKNKPDAVRCAHCGVLLVAHKPGAYTTVGITVPAPEPSEKPLSCADRIGELPPDSFALFIMEFEEPIILKNHPKIVIGRDDQMSGEEMALDMTRYGDLSLGISRRHAQIRYADGIYVLEDLGSTNGTWLNRQRLTPGQIYPLHNDDLLWLGPLKLLFCSATAEPGPRATFSLHLANSLLAKEQNLTLDFLQEEVGPYLQAIARVEEVRAFCLGQAAKPIYLLSLQESGQQITVQLEGAGETIALIKKWVAHWRDEHLEMVGGKEQAREAVWQEQLLLLATRMVNYLQPNNPEGERAQAAGQLIRPLTTLITSNLELSS